MHAAKIYVENYANAKKSQVNNTWRSHPPTANSAYQQLSDAAPAHRLCSACIPFAYRLRPVRTHQLTYNR